MTRIVRWSGGLFFVALAMMMAMLLLLNQSDGARAPTTSSVQGAAETISTDLSPPALIAELGVANTIEYAGLSASMNAAARDGTTSRASPEGVMFASSNSISSSVATTTLVPTTDLQAALNDPALAMVLALTLLLAAAVLSRTLTTKYLMNAWSASRGFNPRLSPHPM